MTIAAIASLAIGLIIGYMGQRSRMCFVGGIRDFIIVRDTYLLKGLIAFGLVAWIAFPLLGETSSTFTSETFGTDSLMYALTAIGGFGVGCFSIFANGCPFRQHVLASQGIISSITYLAGFYVGAVIFHVLVVPYLLRFIL